MSLLKVAGTTAASGQLYVDSVFSTWLYTGNGSTQTITNGIDLAGKGGLVWVKERSGALNHNLFDTNRGAGYSLYSDLTNGQSAFKATTLTSFNSSGFSLGSDAGLDGVNRNNQTYVSWTFRKAAKFFDVVTYTGTGSARTIAHSLGVAPGMVIVKRTDTTSNWQVYSNGMTSAAYSMQLNLTAAQASAPTVWNSTAPTSSVFSVGTDATVNASGGTYVAYLYAHDTSSTGIIQCGSSSTNSSGNDIVDLGFEPQWVMIKPIGSTGGDWEIRDIMRGFPHTNSGASLYPNLSSAEVSSGGFYMSDGIGGTNGFQLVGKFTSRAYIYMAIRRPNKPPTSGTQVYNAIANRVGTSATATISGVGFPVDLMIPFSQTSGSSKPFVDRLRGATKYLLPPYSNTEQTNTDVVTSFANNDGVIVGADATLQVINNYYDANRRYAASFFKRAPGFFDVVCYTGESTARTVPHNLAAVPEMMIVKRLNGGSYDWWVYDAIDGNTKYLVLNSTAIPTTSSTAWNSTTPTASVFSIGTAANVNQIGVSYVAYLFATLAGISKVGSYTGNGSTGQAIACGFSAGARFVLIKRTDATGDWYMFDYARGLSSGSSPYLILNTTGASETGNNGVYASTGGFTLGSTASTTTNINTATYIFLAVA